MVYDLALSYTFSEAAMGPFDQMTPWKSSLDQWGTKQWRRSRQWLLTQYPSSGTSIVPQMQRGPPATTHGAGTKTGQSPRWPRRSCTAPEDHNNLVTAHCSFPGGDFFPLKRTFLMTLRGLQFAVFEHQECTYGFWVTAACSALSNSNSCSTAEGAADCNTFYLNLFSYF